MMGRSVMAALLVLMIFAGGCISGLQGSGTLQTPTAMSQRTASSQTGAFPATWVNPLVKWENSTIRLPSQDVRISCSGFLWRYLLEDALPCMLSRLELETISPLAETLKRGSLKQSVWNILEWEGEWVGYDWEKAALPPARIVTYPDGRQEVVEGQNNTIQTPYETIMRGKGVCTDYTLLTDALLLAMNYSPVYAMEINLENGPGHAAALVEVNGWYFVLDQHLPPTDLGAYYRYWRREGNGIVNATLYEITPGRDLADVRSLGVLQGSEFLNQDYTMKEDDAQSLAAAMMEVFEKEFELKADDSLVALSQNRLPHGYKAGWTFKVTFYGLADYYHPFFLKQYTGWLESRALSGMKLPSYVKKSDSIWAEVEIEGNDLVVTIYLGDSR